jgi:hypothetical protein
MIHRTGIPAGLLLLALLCAISFGALVRVALADNYHTTCVGHGFISGSSTSDGSFFSRVEAGCSSTYRECGIYNYGSFVGAQAVFDGSSLCSAWSRDFGDYTECASGARATDPGVFTAHTHNAPGWCG